MKSLKNKKPKVKMTKADLKEFGALYRARDKVIESLIAVWGPYVANDHCGQEVDLACDLLSKVHRAMSDKYIEIMRLRGLL
jgi:hypothetical protein